MTPNTARGTLSAFLFSSRAALNHGLLCLHFAWILLLTFQSGCAYQRYMQEEEARQHTLSHKLKVERARAIDLEAKTAPLKSDRHAWRAKIRSEERRLLVLRERLRQLQSQPSKERTSVSQRDEANLQRRIAILEERVKRKEKEVRARGLH